MLFLADVMLGRLARWLRLLGHETAYADGKKDDDELIKQAGKNNAVLLTRDEALYAKAKDHAKCLLIESNDFGEQIKEVKKAFKLKTGKDIPQTLCPLCGSTLRKVAKTKIKKEVWPRVYARHRLFWQCTNKACKQIYWRGTHVKEIRKTLEKISRTHSSSLREDDVCAK